MSGPVTATSAPPRQRGRSAIALVAGLLVGVVLSLGTDEILHLLNIYPPWGQTMSDRLFMLATGYRIIYTVNGSYVAARLAPYRPMWNATLLGVVEVGMSIAGAAVLWTHHPLVGPHWYVV